MIARTGTLTVNIGLMKEAAAGVHIKEKIKGKNANGTDL